MAFFIFKVFDYSLFRGAKELIYMPLDFDSRYRAKEIIDVLGYRTGKGGSALAVLFLQKIGLVMSSYYLLIGFVMSFFWLALVFPLTRRNQASKSAD
jgi:ATP/ADP translocase